MIEFLNLPIWVNLIDPTDLSLPTILPTSTLDQTSSIGWTQPHPQHLNQGGHAALVEVEG